MCFIGTSSVEDKLDADARSVWVGNVSLFLFCFSNNRICGRYVVGHNCKTGKFPHTAEVDDNLMLQPHMGSGR